MGTLHLLPIKTKEQREIELKEKFFDDMHKNFNKAVHLASMQPLVGYAVVTYHKDGSSMTLYGCHEKAHGLLGALEVIKQRVLNESIETK